MTFEVPYHSLISDRQYILSWNDPGKSNTLQGNLSPTLRNLANDLRNFVAGFQLDVKFVLLISSANQTNIRNSRREGLRKIHHQL